MPEIAAAVGRSVPAVWTKLHNIEALGDRSIPHAVRENILAMAREGATVRRIARRYGLKEDVAVAFLARRGIEARTINSYGSDRRASR
ncbi:hypothetical protein [Aureimonas mangrovi]|uniref:hypothetical protein n=1 Tax=Aureimonas mangrovi TaxID=2758041 RepID=UPI00163DC181|nr:hypothetical protein [Aureimonas mangrovi]